MAVNLQDVKRRWIAHTNTKTSNSRWVMSRTGWPVMQKARVTLRLQKLPGGKFGVRDRYGKLTKQIGVLLDDAIDVVYREYIAAKKKGSFDINEFCIDFRCKFCGVDDDDLGWIVRNIEGTSTTNIDETAQGVPTLNEIIEIGPDGQMRLRAALKPKAIQETEATPETEASPKAKSIKEKNFGGGEEIAEIGHSKSKDVEDRQAAKIEATITSAEAPKNVIGATKQSESGREASQENTSVSNPTPTPRTTNSSEAAASPHHFKPEPKRLQTEEQPKNLRRTRMSRNLGVPPEEYYLKSLDPKDNKEKVMEDGIIETRQNCYHPDINHYFYIQVRQYKELPDGTREEIKAYTEHGKDIAGRTATKIRPHKWGKYTDGRDPK